MNAIGWHGDCLMATSVVTKHHWHDAWRSHECPSSVNGFIITTYFNAENCPGRRDGGAWRVAVRVSLRHGGSRRGCSLQTLWRKDKVAELSKICRAFGRRGCTVGHLMCMSEWRKSREEEEEEEEEDEEEEGGKLSGTSNRQWILRKIWPTMGSVAGAHAMPDTHCPSNPLQAY